MGNDIICPLHPQSAIGCQTGEVPARPCPSVDNLISPQIRSIPVSEPWGRLLHVRNNNTGIRKSSQEPGYPSRRHILRALRIPIRSLQALTRPRPDYHLSQAIRWPGGRTEVHWRGQCCPTSCASWPSSDLQGFNFFFFFSRFNFPAK